MTRLVRFRVLDGIAVITMEAPPQNALQAPLRAGLWQVFDKVAENPQIKAAVLMAAGDTFSAGSDIAEIVSGKTEDPALGVLCSKIEDCPKPVVAAIHGTAISGGVDLALAAHYRVAAPDAVLGFPDLALGLVPIAGATQRLPRLVGPEIALQMLISTNRVPADAGCRIGLIDGLVNGDLASGAVAFANSVVETGRGVRPTRARREVFEDGRGFAAAIRKARTALADNPLHAPDRVIDCVEAAALLPFEAGLAFEADALERCLSHPQSIALRHVYKAERKIDEALIEREGAQFRPVVPMGKSVVNRLRKAVRDAAEHMVSAGAATEDEIDAIMIEYGFRKGPFGGKPEPVAGAQIALRIVAAMMVEGARCVEEGAVQRPADVDALAVHGMGFPRRKGGPMRAAQTTGLIGLRKVLRSWSDESELWAPPALLDEAIKDAQGFDALGG